MCKHDGGWLCLGRVRLDQGEAWGLEALEVLMLDVGSAVHAPKQLALGLVVVE